MTKVLLTILTIFIVFMWWVRPEGGYENHKSTLPTSGLTEADKQAVRFIRLRGFQCNEVSGTSISEFKGEYYIWCDNHRYSYTIKDLGGSLTVKIN